jgi:hypothetical protein
MNPGDEWWNKVADDSLQTHLLNDAIQAGVPRRPGQYLQDKPEPDTTGTYNSGGRVQKFGSSTHVTCKSKG